MSIPDEIVEKAARAMAVADGRDPDDPAYVQYPGPQYFGKCWRDKYAEKARAAITAVLPDVTAAAVVAERRLLDRAMEELRLVHMKDRVTVYNTLLRVDYEISLLARSNTP